MQASTYFQKVRRMLLFHAPLISRHFWPASTLLRGHLALATLSLLVNDPQISERWACAREVHLDKCNRVKDFGLEFGMTCNSLCELHTLDRVRHVSALPENRLRRRHVLKYATQLPCIRKSTFRWIVPISYHFFSQVAPFDRDIHLRRIPFLANCLFQHSHSTFVITRFGPFRRLFINLTMCEWELLSKPTTTLGLVIQAFWRVPFFTKWVIASSS